LRSFPSKSGTGFSPSGNFTELAQSAAEPEWATTMTTAMGRRKGFIDLQFVEWKPPADKSCLLGSCRHLTSMVLWEGLQGFDTPDQSCAEGRGGLSESYDLTTPRRSPTPGRIRRIPCCR